MMLSSSAISRRVGRVGIISLGLIVLLIFGISFHPSVVDRYVEYVIYRFDWITS